MRLVLQVSSIEHDQPGEFVRGRGRDDFAAKSALGQQGQPPAMIEVGMRQQHKIDANGVETKVAGIFLCDLAATLIEPAIDQKTPAGTFDEVARPSNVAISPVKRQPQAISPADQNSLGIAILRWK